MNLKFELCNFYSTKLIKIILNIYRLENYCNYYAWFNFVFNVIGVLPAVPEYFLVSIPLVLSQTFIGKPDGLDLALTNRKDKKRH